MATARLEYVAPWWTYWLHNFPHVDLVFQPVDNTFRPEEESYQQVGDPRCSMRAQCAKILAKQRVFVDF